jgi:CubicO group peptidase (beta-lactamase class C family)
MSISDLKPMIENELEEIGVPGCSYAVVNSEGLIASGGVGLADAAQSRPATSKTAYHLFSATKLYTATAIMQLIESGKLSLETPFTQILQEHHSEVLDTITIRHLLNHTSGLADTIPAVLAAREAGLPAPSTFEVLARFKLKPQKKPGGKVQYRNVNYVILGSVIEQLTGKSYVDYISEHILQPLGVQAAFTFTTEMRTDMATGYLSRWNPMLLILRLAMPELARISIGERVGRLVALKAYDLDTLPIGGLVGSAVGFAPFIIAHLNDGEGILQPESARQMRELTANGQAGLAAKVGTGLGWKIGESNTCRFYSHEGSGAGFTTETRIYPERDLGVILMMNGYGISVHRAQHRICEALIAPVQ